MSHHPQRGHSGNRSDGDLRTDLAEDRTLLANERTFAAWLRTGLTMVGVGLGVNALYRAVEPTFVAKAISSIFVLLAVVVFCNALGREVSVRRRLEPSVVSPVRRSKARLLVITLSLTSLGLVAAMWLLVE